MKYICGQARDREGGDSIPQQAWLLKLDEYGCLVPGCHIIDGVEELSEAPVHLSMYPNPTSNYLNMYFRSERPVKKGMFRVYDTSGRLVHSFSAGRNDTTYIIPVWSWPKGVYALQYVAEGEVWWAEKVVVEWLIFHKWHTISAGCRL